MIIIRSPLRISLGGGGTDLPSYYREHGGFVLSAAINKYVYVTLNESFKDKIILKYSHLEEVDTVDQVAHPVIREALKMMSVTKSVDLANMSDIPAGTGLGSSGAFTVALLQALHTRNNTFCTKQDLAEEAYHIERELLGQPVGKQDQYISAFGGITSFGFHKDDLHNLDFVDINPVSLSPETFANLEDNLLLFFTGYSRSASDILKDQDTKSAANDDDMIENLHDIKQLGLMSYNALRDGDLNLFAEFMDSHWQTKRERSGMSNPHIDELYELGIANGALGGKLVGAGGGGFLMFYAEDKTRLRAVMRNAGLREVRFHFDFEGTKILVNS